MKIIWTFFFFRFFFHAIDLKTIENSCKHLNVKTKFRSNDNMYSTRNHSKLLQLKCFCFCFFFYFQINSKFTTLSIASSTCPSSNSVWTEYATPTTKIILQNMDIFFNFHTRQLNCTYGDIPMREALYRLRVDT